MNPEAVVVALSVAVVEFAELVSKTGKVFPVGPELMVSVFDEGEDETVELEKPQVPPLGVRVTTTEMLD